MSIQAYKDYMTGKKQLNSTQVEIKFLRLDENAQLPSSKRMDPLTGDTGYDIYASAGVIVPSKGSAVVPVGIQVAYVTPGYWWRVEARSGLSFKHSVIPHFGVMDNQYRGLCGIKIYNLSDKDYEVSVGDKIAQLVVYELIQPKISWADSVEDTDRGNKGFGSSGK